MRWVRRRLDAGAGDGGAGGDRGGSAVEFVFLTPLMFVIIFAAVQFALYSFAEDVAKSAAQAGARVARAEADQNPNWPELARAQAVHYVDQLTGEGGGVLSDPGVSAARAGDSEVRVEVTGSVPSLVFGLDLTVTVSSQGPIERFDEDT